MNIRKRSEAVMERDAQRWNDAAEHARAHPDEREKRKIDAQWAAYDALKRKYGPSFTWPWGEDATA